MAAKRIVLLGSLLLLVCCSSGLAGCGGKQSGPALLNDDTTPSSPDTGDRPADVSVADVCTPECDGRECGDDGCDGSCGTCAGGLACGADGRCEEVPCVSSKDCPDDLVCWTEGGRCVLCVGDEDCPPATVCGGDHECHLIYECASDKDCKDYLMVCDKDGGICVQCLTSADCAEPEFCDANYCLPDVCTGSEARCSDLDVEVCAEDGSGWGVETSCTAGQYCEAGACHDFACAAGAAWCDGAVAMVCSEDGKVVADETDCAAADQFCFQGECLDTLCAPTLTTCVDDVTVGHCNDDGSELTPESCPAEHFCDNGVCLPWECVPDSVVCMDDVIWPCNEIGSEYLQKTDCTLLEQVCYQGECTDLICLPAATTCHDPTSLQHCAEDGLSFTTEPCADGTWCQEGACVDWLCTPDQSSCVGDELQTCDEFGSGPLEDVVDCAQLGGCCRAGQCAVNEEEVCDGLDNDCDGVVDNGVLSPCGDCNPDCGLVSAGPGGDNPFDPTGGASYGVGLDENGFLSTEAVTGMPHFLWIANSGEQTISKVDTESALEVGRYSSCSSPSRTAVDLEGNVYVGCRSDGGVMKIIADPAQCTDNDGDGTVETSTGSATVPGDECIAYLVYPGGTCARALGVGPQGYVWVGDWNAKTIKQLDPDNGALISSIDIGCSPYGLAVDEAGIVWVSGRGCNQLVRVDPTTQQVQKYNPPTGNLYGVAVDPKGHIWLGHYSNHGVSRYKPETGKWDYITSGIGSGCPRGMATALDGYVYTGLGCSGTQIARINSENLAVNLIDVSPGTTPIGVTLDSENNVWAVCYSTSNAVRIDPATQQVTATVPVGKNPYTYSDMTGYILHNITLPDLNPYYVHEFATDAGQAGNWLKVKVSAESNGLCPEMGLKLRPAKNEQDESTWVVLSASSPIGNAEFDLNGLAKLSSKLEVRLDLPYQSEGCAFKVTGLSATYE